MDQLPCPDGYLLDVTSANAAGHHALNEYLMRVEDAGWQVALREVNSIKNKGLKLAIWKALIERMHWLGENRSRSECLSPLRGLAERIEKWTLAPAEADLIEILERTADARNYLAPYTPIPHVIAYVDTKGLTAELAQAVRGFRARVYDDCLQVNQVSLQLFRSRLDMLAWRDEWTPIDGKRCWSEQVRADFRAMQGRERESWQRLLYSIHGDEGTRPAPKWAEFATKAIDEIGGESFRARLAGWLQPLGKGTKNKLSREGSYLLRALIWMAQLAGDHVLMGRVAELTEVSFSPKANGQKVIQAAAVATGVPNPDVAPAAAQPRFEDLLARALTAVTPGLAGRMEVGAEVVHVRGHLDSYEVQLAGGAIYRRSDGRRIVVASGAPSPLPMLLPGLPLRGVMELVRNILLLADDARNASTLTVAEE